MWRGFLGSGNGETDFGVWVILVKSPISALAEKSDSGNPASKTYFLAKVYALFHASSLLVLWPDPYLTHSQTLCVFPNAKPFFMSQEQSLQWGQQQFTRLLLFLFVVRDKIPASSLQ
jgi:hypothetical protein